MRYLQAAKVPQVSIGHVVRRRANANYSRTFLRPRTCQRVQKEPSQEKVT